MLEESLILSGRLTKRNMNMVEVRAERRAGPGARVPVRLGPRVRVILPSRMHHGDDTRCIRLDCLLE